jgi:hypothetical protein
MTPWHITFGTYGTRLHGSFAPTVDKLHNERGTDFLRRNPTRVSSDRERMKFGPINFTHEQRVFVEVQLPLICERGGWHYRTCAAGRDHVHLLCDAAREIHGEKVRWLVKRWLGQEMSERSPINDGATWWAEGGSNIAIHEEKYLNNAFRYILDQRATAPILGAVGGTAR